MLNQREPENLHKSAEGLFYVDALAFAPTCRPRAQRSAPAGARYQGPGWYQSGCCDAGVRSGSAARRWSGG